MKIIGITGGSGSGKSSIATYLASKYSDKVTYLTMDDYFKRSSNAVKDENGEIDWDNPDSLDFEKFYNDLLTLKSRQSIKIMSKSKFYNPDFQYKVYEKKEVEILPKEIIITEGFMLFYDKRVRDILDYKIFLDIPLLDSLNRRDTDKHKPDERYVDKYLLPNHTNNIEPTKEYADLVINVKKNNLEDTIKMLEPVIIKSCI